MKIEIDEFRQDENSVDCNLVSLKMLLHYYGIDKDLEELKKKIKLVKIGSYLPQIGKYLQDLGFETEIITLNPFLFTNNDKRMTRNEIYQRIIKRKDQLNKTKRYNALRHFKNYLDTNGKIQVKIPNIIDIQKSLKNGSPLMCIYTSNFLVGKEPKFNMHSCLIYGVDDKFVYVKDPLWDYRGGDQKYLHEDFLFGLWGSMAGDPDNGALMVIKNDKTNR